MKIATVVTIVFLCGQTLCHAQVAKPGTRRKPQVPIAKPTPSPTPPQELSKEFMLAGRKAFASLERLGEHVSDSRSLEVADGQETLSDEKAPWTLREIDSEKAVDDLQSVAEKQEEKYIAAIARLTLMQVKSSHDLIELETAVAANRDNARSLEEKVLTGSRLSTGTAGAVDVDARQKAEASVHKILTDRCYVVASEAASSGFLKDDYCKSKADHFGKAPETSQ